MAELGCTAGRGEIVAALARGFSGAFGYEMEIAA
jgi:hypothetical protein